MTPEEKIFRNQVLQKIGFHKSHINRLLGNPGMTCKRAMVIEIDQLDVPRKDLRTESAQRLICRNLSAIHRHMMKLDHFVDLVKYENLIDKNIAALVRTDEVSRIFEVEEETLKRLASDKLLSHIYLDDSILLDWSEILEKFGR